MRNVNQLTSIVLLVLILLLVNCYKAEKKQKIKIEKGKVGIIGYGSMMSLKSMESTIKEKYQDSIYLVHLLGYQREWNYGIYNYDTIWSEEDLKYDGFFVQNKDTLLFEKTIYLNIVPQKDSRMNCVLYFISSEKLKRFDEREKGYKRIDVSNMIEEYDFQSAKVYAYKALPNYVYHAESDKKISIIEKRYVDLVTAACDSIGLDFRREYEASTKSFNPDMVAKVLWKKVR